jgi:hypothetical protein
MLEGVVHARTPQRVEACASRWLNETLGDVLKMGVGKPAESGSTITASTAAQAPHAPRR